MSRKRFTEREVLRTLVLQGAKIPCGCSLMPDPFPKCGLFLTLDDLKTPKGVQRDHTTPLALGGPDTPENCGYWRQPCHDCKTDGGKSKATTYGSDRHAIDKTKRLRGETCAGPKQKIRSRGFPKKPDGAKHNWKKGGRLERP